MNLTSLSWQATDIPKAFTALAEWMSCMVCIRAMKRRFAGTKLAAASAAALVLLLGIQLLTTGFRGINFALGMAVAIAAMYGFLRFCLNENGRMTGFLCVQALLLAEMAASLEWVLDDFLFGESMLMEEESGVRILLMLVTYGVIFGTAWCVVGRYKRTLHNFEVSLRELTVLVILAILIFLASNLSFLALNTPFTGKNREEILRMRALVDMGGFALVYAYAVQRVEQRVRRERDSIRGILQSQADWRRQEQETAELIQYKYHDLKHQIYALCAEGDSINRKEYLESLQKGLERYEVFCRSGNDVLDILLSAKGLQCAEHQIPFITVVDGKLLDFMDIFDLCSVYGNALDNAIECEMKIADREKRLVRVRTYAQQGFVMIVFENNCYETVVFEDGMPVTAPKDGGLHGYGLKSLRHIAKKYGGEAQAGVRNHVFSLNILIPMGNRSES